MTFFNKKEDVVEVQLTQYGKYLLSKGKFKPSYYAFFDDGIIYDASYGGITDEEQNAIQERIEKTPVLKTQYTFNSREKAVKELIENSRISGIAPTSDEDSLQESNERNYSLLDPLGTSQISSDKNPSWNVNFLKGEYTSSSTNIPGTPTKPAVNIPQINLKAVEYNTEVRINEFAPDPNLFYEPTGESVDQYPSGTTTDVVSMEGQYSDGSYVKVIEDYLLIDVQEINSDFDNENFDIEVFAIEEVTSESGGELIEKLEPLKFVKVPSFIKNDILQDEPDSLADENLPALDPTYVEYWFNINCDYYIENDILCANRARSINRGGIFSQDSLRCPDDVYNIVQRDKEEEEC